MAEPGQSDREAFLRAVCENPADDTPRLVFADWLDEHGDRPDDPARAEFIRVQGELAGWRTPPGSGSEDYRWHTRMKRRESELLAAHPEWSRCRCPECDGKGTTATDYYGLHGGRHLITCRTCGGTGDLFVSPPPSGLDGLPPPVHRSVTFARGFPDAVSCTLAELGRGCPDCTDGRWRNGRDGCCRTCDDKKFTPTSWAVAVVRQSPVTRFALMDRQPVRVTGSHLPPCSWLRDGGSGSPSMLPDWLFVEVPANGPTPEHGHWGRFYRNEADAHDALTLAAGRVVRRHAYPNRLGVV